MIWIVSVVFVACMVFGMPIVFALGIPGAIYILLTDVPMTMIPAKMFSGVMCSFSWPFPCSSWQAI